MEEQELHMAYWSQLAPGQDYSVFPAICRVSRARNPELGIAGVLVFDGMRFFQWLHGPSQPVADLMAVIATDRRHVDFTMCLEARRPVREQPAFWYSGFVDPDELDALLRDVQPSADAALAAIRRMVEGADLEPVALVRPSDAPGPQGRPTD